MRPFFFEDPSRALIGAMFSVESVSGIASPVPLRDELLGLLLACWG